MSILTWDGEEQRVLEDVIHRGTQEALVAVNTYNSSGDLYTKCFVKALFFLKTPKRCVSKDGKFFFSRSIETTDMLMPNEVFGA
jgi:uncharacterized protein YjhX (UPF0386 family)